MAMNAPTFQSQSIPPDFFTNPHINDAEAEATYSLHRQGLQAALNLPANNRWVADWLFQDFHTPFHRNISLPPEAFDKSLSMEVMHHFCDFEMPVCPITRMRNKERDRPPSTTIRNKGTDMLLLPVASMNGITVGYSFATVHANGSSESERHAFCGRFAFEIVREELLVIVSGNQPDVPEHDQLMVIMSFSWNPNAVQMHNPTKRPVPMDIQALQSLFMDNPSPDVIGDMLETSPPSVFVPGTDGPTQEDLADIFELPPTTSDLPWFLDSSGKPQDNVGIPRHPGDIQTSSGAFNMDTLSEALPVIEKSLQGDFYGTRQTMGSIHPMAQARPKIPPGMSTCRNVVARVSRSERTQSESLRQYSLHLYLSHVLPITSDIQFMTQSDQKTLSPNLNLVATQLQPAPAGRARRIAPLPLPSSSGESEPNTGLADEEERKKEEKREAKRRRNRLSAAKSNDKRRENWQMQQRALASLRNRVLELEGRKVALTTENKLLKERLTTVSE